MISKLSKFCFFYYYSQFLSHYSVITSQAICHTQVHIYFSAILYLSLSLSPTSSYIHKVKKKRFTEKYITHATQRIFYDCSQFLFFILSKCLQRFTASFNCGILQGMISDLFTNTATTYTIAKFSCRPTMPASLSLPCIVGIIIFFASCHFRFVKLAGKSAFSQNIICQRTLNKTGISQ